MKIHYWRTTQRLKKGLVEYVKHHAWCGHKGYQGKILVTMIPGNVTCERCKKTTKWLEDSK